MTTELLHKAPATERAALNAAIDQGRCDRCQAQAFYAALFSRARTPLLFCAHHATRHETEIVKQAAEVHDKRSTLTS